MSAKEHSAIRWVYAAGALGGAIAFFIGSLRLAWEVRQHQISGQPMPNGKGGFMTFGDGYLLAVAMLLFSIVCVMLARRFIRAR